MRHLLLLCALVCALYADAEYIDKFEMYQNSDGWEVRGVNPNNPPSGKLVIPGGVNSTPVVRIADEAFKGNLDITGVVIPASVEYIGSKAFDSCLNITEVVMGASVKYIGSEAFARCISLTGISTAAETIGVEAFQGCYLLSAVQLWASVKYIESGAFADCTALTAINIPFTVERLGDTAFSSLGVFEDCLNLRAVTFTYNLTDELPNLKRIGYNTFKNCISLSKLDFPYSLTYIGTDAFLRCVELKHMEWGGPETLSIGRQNLTDVPLSRIVCHGNIRLTEQADFSKLTNLAEVRYDTYATTVQTKLYKGLPKLKEVHLANVTEVESSAFQDCVSLAELELSPELEKINMSAFSGCSALTDLTIPGQVSKISSGAFSGCTSLENINFTGDNLTAIEGSAFQGCEKLTEVAIPMNVSSLGSDSFDNCTSLRRLTVGGATSIPLSSFARQSPIESLHLRGNVNSVPSNWKTTLKEVKFTDYCNTIGSNSFYGFPGLTELDFSNIIKINSYAFNGCTSLTSVDLTNVEEIGVGAFSTCTSLASVKFGNKIKEIPSILDHTAITSLVIPDNVTSFKSLAYCPNLTSVTIGDGVTTVLNFPSCDNLKEICLGKNIAAMYANNNSLRKISCANPVPPSAYSFAPEVYNSARLIVPVGAIEAYKSHYIWKNFYNIEEMTDDAGVDEVIAEDSLRESEVVSRYDLTGRMVRDDYRGIVLLKYSDGTTRKMMQR